MGGRLVEILRTPGQGHRSTAPCVAGALAPVVRCQSSRQVVGHPGIQGAIAAPCQIRTPTVRLTHCSGIPGRGGFGQLGPAPISGRAPGQTPQIHARIGHLAPAAGATTHRLILPELNGFAASRTGMVENVLWLPARRILTRTAWFAHEFHLLDPTRRDNHQAPGAGQCEGWGAFNQ